MIDLRSDTVTRPTPAMIEATATAALGDDVIDLAVMRECGLAIAVANAREQVKAEAHYVTPHKGGEGAGRRPDPRSGRDQVRAHVRPERSGHDQVHLADL